jgi:aspartyl aminopeptidase
MKSIALLALADKEEIGSQSRAQVRRLLNGLADQETRI